MSALEIQDDYNFFPVPFLNAGASECSDKLNKVVAKAYRHIRAPLSRSLSIADLIPELFEVVEDCSGVNWDGYDALPIRQAAFKDSLSFMMSMPSWMPRNTISGKRICSFRFLRNTESPGLRLLCGASMTKHASF